MTEPDFDALAKDIVFHTIGGGLRQDFDERFPKRTDFHMYARRVSSVLWALVEGERAACLKIVQNTLMRGSLEYVRGASDAMQMASDAIEARGKL